MFVMRDDSGTLTTSQTRAVVVDGSLGGLAAALALGESGGEVKVFERCRGSYGGAGIVVQPELLHFLEERGIDRREEVEGSKRCDAPYGRTGLLCPW